MGGSVGGSNVEVSSDCVGGVAWMQRHPEVIGCYDLAFRAPLDGGRTFGQAAQVAKAGECGERGTDGTPVERAASPVWRRWRNGGEYFGFATDSGGRFHLLWAQPPTIHSGFDSSPVMSPSDARHSHR